MQLTRRNLFSFAATGAVVATAGRAFAWEEALVAPFLTPQVRRAMPRAGMVILSSNENPYGPLPRGASHTSIEPSNGFSRP